MTFTKDMTMGEMIDTEPAIYTILTSIGMHCIGCPSSTGESLEDACYVHGLDPDAVINYINEYLKLKEESDAENA